MGVTDGGQQVGAEQMTLDHEKKDQKPEKVDRFDPLDHADSFIFPEFPVHS
jgi:hypothetical protein